MQPRMGSRVLSVVYATEEPEKIVASIGLAVTAKSIVMQLPKRKAALGDDDQQGGPKRHSRPLFG
jgi:hypothetical protein